jgi:hypothetical protein
MGDGIALRAGAVGILMSGEAIETRILLVLLYI